MEINRHKSTLNIHRIKAHSIQSFLASISVSFLFDSIIARWRKQSIYTSIYVPTNSMSGFSFFLLLLLRNLVVDLIILNVSTKNRLC